MIKKEIKLQVWKTKELCYTIAYSLFVFECLALWYFASRWIFWVYLSLGIICIFFTGIKLSRLEDELMGEKYI